MMAVGGVHRIQELGTKVADLQVGFKKLAGVGMKGISVVVLQLAGFKVRMQHDDLSR